jgi:hypothetical protein
MKKRKAPGAKPTATAVVCPLLLALEQERDSVSVDEFVTRFAGLVDAELNAVLAPHFFQVFETTLHRLGVARLLPSSPSLVDVPVGGDGLSEASGEHAVDLDRMLLLCKAMMKKVSALAPDHAAAVRKLDTRIGFFDDRRVNAAAWHAELLAALAAPLVKCGPSTGDPNELLVGLTAQQHRRFRALLFYRHCEFARSLMNGLMQRIKAESRGFPPANELMLEFWTVLASMRCCTEPSVTEPLPDDVRRLAVDLLRLVANRRQACGLQKKQGVRLLDWITQAELAGLVAPQAAAAPKKQSAAAAPSKKRNATAISSTSEAAAASTTEQPRKRGWVRPVSAAEASSVPKEALKQQRRNKKKQQRKERKAGGQLQSATKEKE